MSLPNVPTANHQPRLIALFGGTFDPIHNGHLQTVTALKHDLLIDQVRWVVSAKPPHRNEPSATPEERQHMLSLALAGKSDMVSDDIELKRQGPSYTVLTLQAYRQKFPDDHLLLVVGADVIASFDQWHHYQQIPDLAHIIVMHRPGYSVELPSFLEPLQTQHMTDLKHVSNGKVLVYAAPEIAISATAIRRRLSQGQNIDGMVPDVVLDYINERGLYQAGLLDPAATN